MMFFKKKEEEEFKESEDRLIIYDDELKTTTIDYVDQVKDGQVTVYGKNAVPIKDCLISHGIVHGQVARVYYYNAPTESIKTTENLAALEQSIVLSQITDYSDPYDKPQSFDWVKAALFGLLAIAIVVGMSSCGAGV